MGSCPSHEVVDVVQRAKARQIDLELMQERQMQESVIKLLLLGTGECGKSTVLKQMRILHANGFTEEEKVRTKAIIYSNTVMAMVALLHGMNKLGIPLKNPELESAAGTMFKVLEENRDYGPLSREVVGAIKALWADKNLREKVFPRGHEFQLSDNCEYFLDAIDRTSREDFVPTEQDMLHTKIKTTGIVEVKFKMKAVNFRVFDVGGQRSERKKWIHCFDGVDSIIYIAAVNEFDQKLSEDAATNRLVETMRLFKSICNSKWFNNTSMILFLNKKDLFEEKIKRVSIKQCFSSYRGRDTYEDQIKYIEQRFERLRANPEKAIYTHHTCATDTNQIQLILDAVIEEIIKSQLKAGGLY